jgi:membrane protein implicated in regulation of membrane protease activity
MDYWWWLLIGAAMIVLEILAPSFVLIWFGIAALITGILAYWVKGLAPQLGLFALFSTISFAIGWFGILRHWKLKTGAGQSKEAVFGETGIVASVKAGDFPSGKVRFQVPVLGDDVWEFICDESLAVGDRCSIVDVLGSKLKVRKSI